MLHKREISPGDFDCMKSSASLSWVHLVVQPDQGLSKETDDVNYRMRLSPQCAADRLGGHGNRRMRRTTAEASR